MEQLLLFSVFLGQALSLYFQNGFYEAFAVMQIFLMFAACVWATSISELLALPLFGTQPIVQMRMKRNITLVFCTIAVVNLINCIAMAATVRQESRVFNIAVLSYNLSLFAAESTFGMIILHFGSRLKRDISMSVSVRANKWSIKKKIAAMQLGGYTLILAQAPIVVASIVILAIGSFPYFWVLEFIVLTSAVPALALSTIILLKSAVEDSGKSVETETPNSSSRLFHPNSVVAQNFVSDQST